MTFEQFLMESRITLRMSEDLRKQAKVIAAQEDKSLNTWIVEAIQEKAQGEEMKAAERVKDLMKQGWTVVTNPYYLDNPFAEMSDDEIRALDRGPDGQLPGGAQQEMSLRGQRLSFIQFHRWMFSLSNSDVQQLKNAMRKFAHDMRLAESDSVYCDQRILDDALDYHICIRFEEQFDPAISDQIARHFRQECQRAEDFSEVTSERLINLAQDILSKYSA